MLIDKTAFVAVSVSLLLLGCDGTDPVSKFEGTWSYQQASSLQVNCPGRPSFFVDLAKAAPGGQPATFTMTPVDGDSLEEVDGAGCHHRWTVSGTLASGSPGETCANYPDGMGGTTTSTLVTGTKSITDGERMAIQIEGTFGPGGYCSSHVIGAAIKTP